MKASYTFRQTYIRLQMHFPFENNQNYFQLNKSILLISVPSKAAGWGAEESGELLQAGITKEQYTQTQYMKGQ